MRQIYCVIASGVSTDMGGDGSSELAAGRDCLSIKRYFSGSGRRSFWLFDLGSDSEMASQVFCDQDTEVFLVIIYIYTHSSFANTG